MQKLLKIVHIVGLSVFLGSIPAHIALGRLADPAGDLDGFALLMHAKHMNVLALTLPGLALLLVTGAVLALRRGMTPNKRRWMGAKLALVALIALNGAFVLTPLAHDISASAQQAAATRTVPANFAELARKETVFGAANLALVLAVVGLSVVKPALRRS